MRSRVSIEPGSSACFSAPSSWTSLDLGFTPQCSPVLTLSGASLVRTNGPCWALRAHMRDETAALVALPFPKLSAAAEETLPVIPALFRARHVWDSREGCRQCIPPWLNVTWNSLAGPERVTGCVTLRSLVRATKAAVPASHLRARGTRLGGIQRFKSPSRFFNPSRQLAVTGRGITCFCAYVQMYLTAQPSGQIGFTWRQQAISRNRLVQSCETYSSSFCGFWLPLWVETAVLGLCKHPKLGSMYGYGGHIGALLRGSEPRNLRYPLSTKSP